VDPPRERVVYRTCTLCEACCGIEVHVEDDRIRTIRGDPRDPLSRGHVCSKAVALRDLRDDPDRLRQPIRRRGSGWEPISWSEAFDLAAEGILRTRSAHGAWSVATYLGEPVVHNLGALLFSDMLVEAVNPKARFSANTLDQIPRQLACHETYGSGFFVSVPDVDRTDHMLIIGANPIDSNGGLMTAPGIRHRLDAIRERGGKVIVIDPRRTATAESADAHHFIRPGTDGLLLAALVRTIFDEGRVKLGRLEPITDGLDSVRRAVAAFTPESVAAPTGIDAPTIRALARAFSDAPSAVCYGRMGTSTVRFGTLTSWLIEALNAITGNLDRPGGAMFPRPAVNVLSLQPSTRRGRWHSRTRGVPEFMGELPAASLADEIETPGEGQIRGLVTLAGNPVLSSPAGHRLSDALARLDFMVSIDFYLNETTRHSDVILPPVEPLERGHYDVAFQLFMVRNVARWSPPVFDPPPEGRTDAEILLELARRLQSRRGIGGRLQALAQRAILGLGAERVARWILGGALRSGPYGRLLPWRGGLSLRRVRSSLHGIDLGPLVPALPDPPATKPRRNTPELAADRPSRAPERQQLVPQPTDPDAWTPWLLSARTPRRRRHCGDLGWRSGAPLEPRRFDRGDGTDHRDDDAGGRLSASRPRTRTGRDPPEGRRRARGR
jgi:anaerobic selenocysteine-containing dehydrogenase